MTKKNKSPDSTQAADGTTFYEKQKDNNFDVTQRGLSAWKRTEICHLTWKKTAICLELKKFDFCFWNFRRKWI